jgi:hypothetical protein
MGPSRFHCATLANHNLQFGTNMDTLLDDPAATPATKADVDRLPALLLSQTRTITAQDKLIKSLRASNCTSRTPPEPKLPISTADKLARSRSAACDSGGGKKVRIWPRLFERFWNRTQNRSGLRTVGVS